MAMFRPRRFLAAAAVAAALAAPSVTQAATPGNALVMAWNIDAISTFDPAQIGEVVTSELFNNTCDYIAAFDPRDEKKVVPGLAERWDVSPDGQTITFHLRDNLRFPSGEKATAQDLAWSMQRVVKLGFGNAATLTEYGFTKANVEQMITAADDRTLVMKLDKPYPTTLILQAIAANRVGALLDRKTIMAGEVNGDLGNKFLATRTACVGPYNLRQWNAGETVVLEANPNYWDTAPKLRRIIIRHVAEAGTQRLLLEKGDIDIARNLAPQDLAALASNKDIKSTSAPKGTVYYISLNQKNPNLAKPEVREALKWLVDYAAIGDTLIKNIGIIDQNFMPVGLLGASTDMPYKLDVDKAKALLAKAGLPNGFKVTIDMRTIQPVQGITESFQQTAKRAGIDIEIIPGDGKQVLTKYRARTHDMYIGQWGADYWDPHTNTTFVQNSDNSDEAKAKPLAWRNAWTAPALEKLADAAVLERDTAKRKKMYEDMQAEFRKTSPFIMLFQQTEVAAVRSNVEGFKLGPTFDTNYMFLVSKK